MKCVHSHTLIFIHRFYTFIYLNIVYIYLYIYNYSFFLQTPRPLMFLCIFNLFEFTFCLLFVKSVCVTTTFPLVTRFSKHHMFIHYNILFFLHFFFVFFLRFGKRGKKEERPRNADGRLRTRYLSAVPFVLRSDPRRPLSLRLFSLVVGVFSSSLSFLSNSSVLFSVQLPIPFRRRSSAFEIDFPPSGSIRNHLVNRRYHLAALPFSRRL